MRRLQACFAVAGIALFLTLPVRTQTQNETTFASSVELVLIPTVVKDKSGVHIAGLQKEEFDLKQDRRHMRAVFILFSSAITPPLFFPQSLVPAPGLQIVSGSESSPFSDLLYLLHLSRPGEQSHAQSGSSPRLWDG